MIIKSAILKKDTLMQTQTTLDIVCREATYTVCYNRSSCIVKNCDTLEEAEVIFNRVVNNETKFKLTSDRYPGWVWEKTLENGTENWFGLKEGVGYGVSGIKARNGKIYGELLTKQKTLIGGLCWEPIKTTRHPFDGSMADCVAEAERRAAYHLSKK